MARTQSRPGPLGQGGFQSVKMADEESGKVFVGSLNLAVTADDLSDKFNYVGPGQDVEIVWDHDVEPTPFAFVKVVVGSSCTFFQQFFRVSVPALHGLSLIVVDRVRT